MHRPAALGEPVLFLGLITVVFFALDRIIDRNLDPFEASRVGDRS